MVLLVVKIILVILTLSGYSAATSDFLIVMEPSQPRLYLHMGNGAAAAYHRPLPWPDRGDADKQLDTILSGASYSLTSFSIGANKRLP